MNLIELENLVKGVTDEYLAKEVQAPTGKIPPFLALSEIQRRKDMRQRYEAQKGAVDKPTIAEQIVGGIGGLPQAQGVPAPAAPGGMGAPPVAPGAAPMPTPPGQPQGFAAGGQVGYATGGFTGNLGFLDRLSDEQLATYASLSQDKGIKAAAQQKLDSRASVGKSAPADYAGSDIGGVPSWSPVTVPGAPTPMNAIQANFNRARDAEAAAPAPAPSPVAARPAPVAARPAPAPQVAPGGIGDIPVPPMTPVPSKIPATKYESQAEERYAKMLENDGLFTLPEAINYDEFIQAAGQEEAAIRAAAKQEALGAALVQLGAGLAAGNMAEGFQNAGMQAQQVIKEGRRDAAAQKALAQDLKLRGMEGKREQAIQQARLSLEGAGMSANLARDTRREQEERAYRDQQTAIAAAEREAARADRARNFDLSLKQYELEKRRDAAKTFDQFIENEIGPPPSAKEYAEWQKLPENMRGPDPRKAYFELRKQAAPSAAARTHKIYPDIELSFYGSEADAADRKARREARESGFKYPRPKEIRGNITEAHVQYLKANPSQRDAFNQKFGKGWAEYYLDN